MFRDCLILAVMEYTVQYSMEYSYIGTDEQKHVEQSVVAVVLAVTVGDGSLGPLGTQAGTKIEKDA